MPALAVLLMAVSIDGGAALRHAAALASLGPHAWGSPRGQAAALYVAAQMRAAGLTQVELQRFERHGVLGTNVVAVLPAGDEFVLVAAHHDTAPGSPGACDDGSGVGILIELARTLRAEPARTRTIVFASFDGEESEVLGKGPTAGSRAYLERLGARARSLVAVLDLEMAGWSRGTPLVHPIPYADPRRKGGSLVAPKWLVEAALEGSRGTGVALGVGDPFLSWVYQPAVRVFRARLHGDDLSFVQSRHPALLVSDSSATRFYPDYHAPTDTADELDAPALERMGRATLGVVRALDRVPAGPAEEPHWFAAFDRVLGWPWLLAAAVISVLPGLTAGFAAGGLARGQRLLEVALFGVVFWRAPVPGLWVFLLPHLLLPFLRRWWTLALSVTPLAALLGFGAWAWAREAVSGVWLAPWDIVVAALAFLLSLAAPPARAARRQGRR